MTYYKTILSYLLFLLFQININANGIISYTDTLAAGWAYMDSCTTFEIHIDSTCKLSWTVTKLKTDENNKEEKLILSTQTFNSETYSRCNNSFSSLIPYHKMILDSIFVRWSPSRFKSISYSSFKHGNNCSWNIPIALLSAKSKKYAEYRKLYPNTRYNINALFVEFANQTDAYKELKDLFLNYELKLRLKSVEKVFTPKVKDLQNCKEIEEAGLSSNQRLIWDIGISYFTLEVK